MAAPRYAQINNEIEQHITELQKLEVSAEKHRQELKSLLRQRADIESDLGLSGLTQSPSISRHPRTRSATPSSNGSSDRKRNKEIRDWAIAEGLELPERGPIPKEIHDRYEAAHTDAK